MQKLIKYILMLIILISAMPENESDLVSLVGDNIQCDYTNCYYTTEDLTNIDFDCEEINIVDNGSTKMIYSSAENAKKVLKNLDDIDGQSLSFSGDYVMFKKLQDRLFNSRVKEEKLNSTIISVYGYNRIIKNSLCLDGEKVNIQIAYNNNVITIGCPVILGEY